MSCLGTVQCAQSAWFHLGVRQSNRCFICLTGYKVILERGTRPSTSEYPAQCCGTVVSLTLALQRASICKRCQTFCLYVPRVRSDKAFSWATLVHVYFRRALACIAAACPLFTSSDMHGSPSFNSLGTIRDGKLGSSNISPVHLKSLNTS